MRVTKASDLLDINYQWSSIKWANDQSLQGTPYPDLVNSLLDLTVHPLVPFLSVVAYLVLSGPVFSTISKAGLVPKPALKGLTIIHSLILAVYSGVTFYYAATASYRYYVDKANRDLYYMLCDQKGEVWHTMGLGFWVSHFYLSKYYEFIDTWIIHLGGKEPIFLQTYHHAGIVILMWSFVVTNNTSCGVVVTVLNSFIHTIMYTYYTLAALGYRSPLKKYITQMQLLQFLTGLAILLPPLFFDNCLSDAQRLSTQSILVYTLILIGLFANFYVNSYSKKSGDGKGAQKTGKKNA